MHWAGRAQGDEVSPGRGQREAAVGPLPRPCLPLGGAHPTWIHHGAPDGVLGITLGGSVLASGWERVLPHGEKGGHGGLHPRGCTVRSCPPPWAGPSGSSLFAHHRVDHTFRNSVFLGSTERACEVPNLHDGETRSVRGTGGRRRCRSGSQHTGLRPAPFPACLMTPPRFPGSRACNRRGT